MRGLAIRGRGEVVIAALLALAMSAGPACGLPPLAQGTRPWRTGETLTFDLDVLGVVKAGTLQISVERPMSGGAVVPFRARARTTSSLGGVKSFAGVGLSWVDSATLLPERYRDESEEDSARKVSDTRIRPAGPELVVEYTFGESSEKAAYPREGDVLDPISTIYYLRASRLAPGDRFCFDLVANRRFWRLEGSVASRTERVDTPAGRFQTIRVDATARRVGDPRARPRPLHLWFGTDARKLLVAVVSEVDLGPVRAMLTGVRGGR